VCRLMLSNGACGVNVNGACGLNVNEAGSRPAQTALRTVFIAIITRAKWRSESRHEITRLKWISSQTKTIGFHAIWFAPFASF